MNAFGELWRRLRYIGRRRKLDRELEAELRFHLDMKARELVEKGMPEEEARWAARREFGNRSLAMEDSRMSWRFNVLETLLQDVRYGLRTLARNRVFTLAVVLTLALGIGANTALFTLVNTVMLRSLPLENPHELYVLGSSMQMSMIQASGPEERNTSFLSHPLYLQLREHSQVFSGLAAVSSFPDYAYMSPELPGASVETAEARLVSGNFFEVLGVRAALGRTFTTQDDIVPGAHPVAVISHDFWSTRFGGDPSVIGTTVLMNATEYTVIGVTPPEFFGLSPGLSTDIWAPLMMQSQLRREPSYLDDMNTMWLRVFGRLKAGVTVGEAAERTNALFHQLLREEAGSDVTPEVERGISQLAMELTPFGHGFTFLRDRYSQPLLILMGVTGLVLLIACANVGNLLLARASTRQREVALRLSLGSNRTRLIRQLLTESVILALAGGAAGFLIAWWTNDFLLTFVSRRLEPSPDGRVLGFTLCASFFAALVFGLAPALRATGVNLTSSLSNRGDVPGKGREGRTRKILVVSQVVLSLLLLIGAGLFLRSLHNLRSHETGFRPEGVLVLEIDPRGGGYTKEQLPHLYRELVERIEAIPEVRSVSLSYYGLFSGGTRRNAVTVDSFSPQSDDDLRIQDTFVTPKYFETCGIALLAGRGFEPSDREGAPRVAVVNETFARHFFGNDSPIGKRFGIDGDGSGNDIEIVGVVSDLKYDDMREETPRYAYYPVFQEPTYLHSMEVRTDADPTALAPRVRQTVTEAAKNLPILEVRPLSEQIEHSFRNDQTISFLMSFFGLLALILASIGLYGVLAYGVAQRTNEIGIRIALGAKRAEVIWLVLREAVTMVCAGILIGIPVSIASARLVSNLLFGLGSADPLTTAGAALILFLVAILAGYLPARRASRMDPTTALRYE
jgi:predicted permease